MSVLLLLNSDGSLFPTRLYHLCPLDFQASDLHCSPQGCLCKLPNYMYLVTYHQPTNDSDSNQANPDFWSIFIQHQLF